MSSSIKCAGCLEFYPIELLQAHHVDLHSQSEETTMLCAGCHHNLHRIAERLSKGKHEKAVELVEGAYPASKKAQKRVLDLASRIAKSMVSIREGKAKLSETVKVSIELEIPRNLLIKLKLQAYEWNGSKAGLRPYLRHLILTSAKGGMSKNGIGKDVGSSQKRGGGAILDVK